jgi:CRP-like cAMP-binding protein
MTEGTEGLGQLLNEVRPCLVPGWYSHPIDLGELAVGNAATGRYVVLPDELLDALPLLDGTRPLHQVSAFLLERTGKVLHKALFEAIAALAGAGLLEPLPEAVAAMLPPVPRQRSTGWPGPAGFLAFMFPHGADSRPCSELPAAGHPRWPALLLLPVAAAALLAVGSLALNRPYRFEDLLWTVAGLVLAASLREAVRFVQLRRLGRSVLGIGLRLTMLVPHFGIRAPDEVMLPHAHRMTYRLWNLAIPGAAGALAAVGGGLLALAPLRQLGVGMLLAWLVALSPLWRSDMLQLLGELVGFRSLRRRSRSFLLRRLWRSVLRSRRPGREELALIWSSSAAVLYLFLLAGVLWGLLPAALEVLVDSVLAPDAGLPARLLAAAAAAALAMAVLLASGSILATVLSLVVQLAGLGRFRPRSTPLEVPDAGSIDSLADRLAAIPPFSGLPPELVRQVLAGARHSAWSAGTPIIEQGAPGDSCFVIRSGICSVVREEVDGSSRQVARLGPGLLFGETALLLDAPRQAAVRAVTPVTLVEIPRTLFLDLVKRSGLDSGPLMDRIRLHQFLASQQFLASADPECLAALVRESSPMEARAGDTLLRTGEPGTDLFVLRSGQCEVTTADGIAIARLGPGDHFGEIALLSGRPRTADVRCLADCSLVRIPAAAYRAVLAREFAAGLELGREAEDRLRELDLA